MWEDPIVKEVRQAGAELARKASNDIHTFFEHMRKAQENYRGKIVQDVPRHKSILTKTKLG